jgi:tol-pal system protein YbgF
MMAMAAPLSAQTASKETLADVRQQLNILYVEIQRLKRNLSTSGSGSGLNGGANKSTKLGGTQARLDTIEKELRRLTARTEEIEYRLQQVVEDGTNRIGDLEFRLVELEGGDVSVLGETTTLGGDIPPGTTGPSGGGEQAQPETELAVGESADFDRAMGALDAGEAQSAADQFDAFLASYPGSPMEIEAHLRRGQALEALQRDTDAARAYLDSYSAGPTSPVAAEALYRLGRSLGRLNQVEQACITLDQVQARYPQSPFVAEANVEMQALACQ